MNLIKATDLLMQKQFELIIAKLEFEMALLGFEEEFEFVKNCDVIEKIDVKRLNFKNAWKITIGQINLGFGESWPDGYLIWKISREDEMLGSPKDFVKWLIQNLKNFSVNNSASD